MSRSKCCCRRRCLSTAITASVVVGIIAAILQITAVISVSPFFLWFVLGAAVVYLAILLLTSGSGCSSCMRDCTRTNLPVLLVAILGTILLALILLAIEFAATSFLGAILVGLLLAFFTLTITATVCLVKCLVSSRR